MCSFAKRPYRGLLQLPPVACLGGLVAVFRARVSSNGKDRLIIFVPKGAKEKLRPYREKKAELLIHVYEED
jgi:hypothetical protein